MSYEELLSKVKKYWGDTSRPASETKNDLRALKDEIDLLIESLPD